MRRGQGFFATLLMIVPMTAVPVMAVFGIPQFVPAARSSPSATTTAHRLAFIESRVGQSDAPVARQVAVPTRGFVDIFQPPGSDRLTSSAGRSSPFSSATGWAGSAQLVTRRQQRGATGQPSDSAQLAQSPSDHSQIFQTGYRTADVSSPQYSDTALSRDRNQPESPVAINTDDDARYQRSTRTGHLPPVVNDVPRRPTWREAVQQLNDRGIRTFRLTPGMQPGTFQFSCLVSSVDDPRVSRWFDAEATEPLDAVARVLVKVEDWNRAR
jgi:hypothetical protein